ncbi:hypothetical protein [Enterococcus nangangensis]|uniref:hypothetical protein n=1 Tax=Enterococcus nangangensis TaxID=2559926 RepID=UPI0010F72383|nr:hypothetical protein [Enterococcus nangangensis]
MTDLSVQDLEDYLTGKLSGITVIDEKIEFPQDAKALYIEGEKDYYLEEDDQLNYVLKDGSGQVKLAQAESNLATFLQNVVHIIAEEENEIVF